MKMVKRGWKKPRCVFPTFAAEVVEHGNSATVSPALPKEYVGKKCLITILDDDEESTMFVEDKNKTK
ncbi:putative transposon-encoded protein [Methanococcus maripaludis]|uniref:Putative transposon-encoded protein n=1 Tax=Methanococcus maripaludis TaxID=39152 RepID=A0A7J9NWJ6_METMI|nr:DUF2080 family transposase-associated protein [Methanococcus maripaludis]MBA2851634.1 putative transposon-encoded protein [Methanococcus maripaludis]